MVMRRSLGRVALATAISTPMAISAASAQQADSAALLATLLKLEAESWQFLKDKDVTGAKDYLGDDALLIFGDGTRFTKDEFLKAIPDIRLESITIAAGAEIRVWTQNAATLLYRVTYASAMKDAKATTMKAMSASTYARRNGKWLNVLYQETPVA
jgi:hypothetical protein